jgi:hypothetical protein
MLAWLAALFFDDAPSTNRRHIRQRYGYAAIGWAERLIANLALIRAVELSGVAARFYPNKRNAAPTGFRRRMRGVSLRAALGARARKAIRSPDAFKRIQLLIAAFADIDAFARRYLVKRAITRLTRICAIIMIAPPAEAVRTLAAPAAAAADTS